MKWLGFFSLLAFSFTGHAADIEHLRRGFLNLEHPSVPAAVRQAAGAIFKIYYPAGDVEILNLSTVQPVSSTASGADWFKNAQIQVCVQQKIENCPVAQGSGQGTAFLVRDPQTVATHFKNIRNWYRLVLLNNPNLWADDLQAPFFLINSKDKTIFNPLQTGLTLKLAFFNRTPGAFETDETSEYVELRLSQPLNDPKPILESKDFDTVAPLYLVGFASPQSQSVSVSESRLRFPLDRHALHLHTSHDRTPGHAGGPLLNVKGEVVSVFANSEAKQARFVSVDHGVLELFWGTLRSARTGGSF